MLRTGQSCSLKYGSSYTSATYWLNWHIDPFSSKNQTPYSSKKHFPRPMAQYNANHPHAYTGLVCHGRLTPPLSFQAQLLPEHVHSVQNKTEQSSVVNKLGGRGKRHDVAKKIVKCRLRFVSEKQECWIKTSHRLLRQLCNEFDTKRAEMLQRRAKVCNKHRVSPAQTPPWQWKSKGRGIFY